MYIHVSHIFLYTCERDSNDAVVFEDVIVRHKTQASKLNMAC